MGSLSVLTTLLKGIIFEKHTILRLNCILPTGFNSFCLAQTNRMKKNLTLAKEGSSFIYEVVGLNELHDNYVHNNLTSYWCLLLLSRMLCTLTLVEVRLQAKIPNLQYRWFGIFFSKCIKVVTLLHYFLYIVELHTSIQTLFSGKCQNLLACRRRPTNWEHLNLKISYCNTILRFITTAKLIISKIFNT